MTEVPIYFSSSVSVREIFLNIFVNFTDHLQSAHGIRVDVNDIDGDTAHRTRVEAEKEMMRNFRSSIDNLIESTVKERETDRWVEGEGDRWVEGDGCLGGRA